METKQEITEQMMLLYNCISEAGNLPEDEEIYNKIEELENAIKNLEGVI